MSWNQLENSQTGPVVYKKTKYSTTLSSATTNPLKVLGYGHGTIGFTNNGNMDVTLQGSVDGVYYFTISTKQNPTQSGDKLSWSIPLQYIKMSCDANIISNIVVVTAS